MQEKNAYSIFRPVDLRSGGFTDSWDGEATARSPFPEDENGDPVSQLRAYRAASHPLMLLAKARSAADVAALAAHFAPIGTRRHTAQDVQLANLGYYRSMFKS